MNPEYLIYDFMTILNPDLNSIIITYMDSYGVSRKFFQTKPFSEPVTKILQKGGYIFIPPYLISAQNNLLTLTTISDYYVVVDMKNQKLHYGINNFIIKVEVKVDPTPSKNLKYIQQDPEEFYEIGCQINYVKDLYQTLMVLNNIPQIVL